MPKVMKAKKEKKALPKKDKNAKVMKAKKDKRAQTVEGGQNPQASGGKQLSELISAAMAKLIFLLDQRPQLMALVTPHLQPELNQILQIINPIGRAPPMTR